MCSGCTTIAQQVRQSFGEMNTRLAEALDGIEVVKGTAQEDAEIDRFVRPRQYCAR